MHLTLIQPLHLNCLFVRPSHTAVLCKTTTIADEILSLLAWITPSIRLSHSNLLNKIGRGHPLNIQERCNVVAVIGK